MKLSVKFAVSMAVDLTIAPEVQQDIDEAYSWYEERRPGLGEEFLSCMEARIQTIIRTPEICEGSRRISQSVVEAIPLRHILRIF